MNAVEQIALELGATVIGVAMTAEDWAIVNEALTIASGHYAAEFAEEFNAIADKIGEQVEGTLTGLRCAEHVWEAVAGSDGAIVCTKCGKLRAIAAEPVVESEVTP